MNTTTPTTSAPTLEPDISEIPEWLLAVHATIVAIMLVASMVSNSFVLFLVAKYKKLRYRSILVSLGVVVADLLLPLVLHFQALASSIAGRWPFGDAGCTTYGFLLLCVYYARWLGTAVIAIDRFLYIVAPFFYKRWSKPLLIVLFVTVWVTPFIFALPVLFGFGAPEFRTTVSSCAVECNDDSVCSTVYSFEFGFYVLVGAGVPTVLYLILYCFGIKKRRTALQTLGTQTSQEAPGGNGRNIPTVSLQESNITQTISEVPKETQRSLEAPVVNGGNTSPVSTTAQMQTYLDSGRRPSNVSMLSGRTQIYLDSGRRPSTVSMLQRLRIQRRPSTSSAQLASRERRAFITFATIFIALAVTQVPIFVTSISRRSDFYQEIPIYVHYIILYIYMLSTTLDPIIVMRNQDFQHAISHLLGRHHSTSDSPPAFVSVTHTGSLSDV